MSGWYYWYYDFRFGYQRGSPPLLTFSSVDLIHRGWTEYVRSTLLPSTIDYIDYQVYVYSNTYSIFRSWATVLNHMVTIGYIVQYRSLQVWHDSVNLDPRHQISTILQSQHCHPNWPGHPGMWTCRCNSETDAALHPLFLRCHGGSPQHPWLVANCSRVHRGPINLHRTTHVLHSGLQVP